MRGMKQKAVDAVTTEPFLHVIGDVARRADQRTLPPSCGEALVDLSDRQSFLPRPANDVAGVAEAAECEFALQPRLRARQRIAEAGLRHAEVIVADVSAHPFAQNDFELAFSRF